MENQQQILIETQFEGLTLYVRPHETHDWLMETRLVAEGYGVDESSLRSTKNRHRNELIEEKHFIGVANCNTAGQGGSLKTFWTKRGVIRLGFFIKSDRAKLFRDWAEDLIIRELDKRNQPDRIDKLEMKMHKYIDALHQSFNKQIQVIKKDTQEIRELIHNLTQRVDKIEAHLFKPHQLPEREAYFYMMKKSGKNEYKLGKSIDPLSRKKDFETVNEAFEILATIKFRNEAHALFWEGTFKAFFADKQIRGEWFALSQQEAAFIVAVANTFEIINF